MLATALTDLTVRDTLLALAVTDMRGDAETLRAGHWLAG